MMDPTITVDDVDGQGDLGASMAATKRLEAPRLTGSCHDLASDDGGDGHDGGGGNDDDGDRGDDGWSRVGWAQALPGDQLVD